MTEAIKEGHLRKCAYEDCDALIYERAVPWDLLREKNASVPEVPQRGICYESVLTFLCDQAEDDQPTLTKSEYKRLNALVETISAGIQDKGFFLVAGEQMRLICRSMAPLHIRQRGIADFATEYHWNLETDANGTVAVFYLPFVTTPRSPTL